LPIWEVQLASIAAELIAVNGILTHVLKHLAADNPGLARAIASGFDDAANQLEKMTLTPGYAFSKDTVEALRIVEKLRATILG
jgi:hypothetical protein